MVENMYRYFDSNLPEFHRTKLYICMLLDPGFKNYNVWTTHKYVQNEQLCTECILTGTLTFCLFWLKSRRWMKWQGRAQGKLLVWMRIRLRNRCVLPMIRTRTTQSLNITKICQTTGSRSTGGVVQRKTYVLPVWWQVCRSNGLINYTARAAVRHFVSLEIGQSGGPLICFWVSITIQTTTTVRKISLNIGMVVCQGTLMSTKRTMMSLVSRDVSRWRQFHGCPVSGGGIEWVFFSAGKHHDPLKKKTSDKTLQNTLKTVINTKLPTCDDKGVFTDDDDTYRKHK